MLDEIFVLQKLYGSSCQRLVVVNGDQQSQPVLLGRAGMNNGAICPCGAALAGLRTPASTPASAR